MHLLPHDGGARGLLQATLPGTEIGIAWLGQSGFLFRHSGSRILIDPYLSDSLATKHAGTEFPHSRLMASPLEAAEIRNLDLVLCTHRHGDHMDSGTLPALAKNNPRCRFVIPRAEREAAIQLGLDASRLVLMNDPETFKLNPNIEIQAIASAHETLEMNEAREHRFLGYCFRFSLSMVYHSGDCVVYEGLADRLRKLKIDLALLPVNGRSERLRSRGIAGNMNFTEARELCRKAEIKSLIPHHWGMFAFNTVEPKELNREMGRIDSSRLECALPDPRQYYTFVR